MKSTLPQSLWATLILFLLLVGCGQDAPQPKPNPSVTAVMPKAAAPGATITLTGENFSPDPAKNVVTFFSFDGTNAVAGVVEQATSTELILRVPLNAFSAGPSASISVITEGRGSSSRVVLKSDSYPDAFSITPQPARVGEVITIAGKNFNLDPKQTILLFLPPTSESIPPGYNPETTPISSTGTTLQAQVPTGAKSGKIWVIHYVKPDGSTYISQTLPITIAP